MSRLSCASSGTMLSALSQFRPVQPWTRIFSVASHSTPQVKPKPPLGLVSAQSRFRSRTRRDWRRSAGHRPGSLGDLRFAPRRARRSARGEAIIVVRFGVMDVAADAFALAVGVIQIPRDVAAGIILEQLGVGPLHAALGQQAFGGFPRTAEAFEQENGFGKFVLHAGDDVLPGGHGNFVAGVATETVHAAPAPDQKRVGDDVPERDVVLFQFHQIFPESSPTRRGWRIRRRVFSGKIPDDFPARSSPSRCG